MESTKPRYQDLTREQAFGIEGRMVMRLFPLLVLEPNTKALDVEQYYSNLFELSYLLIDVGVGNKSLEEVKKKAGSLHEYFGSHNFFDEKSALAVEAIRLVTDALSQLNMTKYFAKPGLSERDLANPDLVMAVAQASRALLTLGMEERVFKEPVDRDCQIVLSHPEQNKYLDPVFFSNKLWPIEKSPIGDSGMYFGFERVILREWKTGLSELGLTGIVSSYENLLSGYRVSVNKDSDNTQSKYNDNLWYRLRYLKLTEVDKAIIIPIILALIFFVSQKIYHITQTEFVFYDESEIRNQYYLEIGEFESLKDAEILKEDLIRISELSQIYDGVDLYLASSKIWTGFSKDQVAVARSLRNKNKFIVAIDFFEGQGDQGETTKAKDKIDSVLRKFKSRTYNLSREIESFEFDSLDSEFWEVHNRSEYKSQILELDELTDKLIQRLNTAKEEYYRSSEFRKIYAREIPIDDD